MSQYGPVDFPSKILIPQRPQHLLSRSRLTDNLRDIVDKRIKILVAPAGCGKTSLLIDFANDVLKLPICWYTLDRLDQDPRVFLGYLTATITQRFSDALQRAIALLTASNPAPIATITATLIRDVASIGSDFVLIFDEWHMVDPIADIGHIVTQLVLYCPNCHIILSSRSYPSIPDLVLLAARQQVSGLSEQHMRFTAAEVASVVQATSDSAISKEQIAALVEQSNGWITGVLLLLQAVGTGAQLPMTDLTSHNQIYQYLAEQVFDQQPQDVRSFLLESSLLQDLTPEWCDMIFGRSDSRDILDRLLQHHVFITEIRPRVLRYHPLFREFLNECYRKTDPQRYRATALRVAEVAMTHEQWPLAFDVCIAAGDIQAAQRVAAAGGEHIYARGQMETLERWFAALPRAALDAPLLCLQARVLLERGGVFEAQALADLAAARMAPGEQLGVMLLQAWLAYMAGRYEQGRELAQQVLGMDLSPSQQVMALRTLAICHYRLNQSEQAIMGLQQALATVRQHADLVTMAQLLHDLGVCHERTSRLQTAEEFYQQADAYWTMLGNTSARAMSRNSLGVVQHMIGRYREAHATLSLALQDARNAAMLRYQATVLASLGDLYSDLQCWEQAHDAYSAARRIGGSTFLMHHLDLANVRLLIHQGAYETAARALQQLSEPIARSHAGVVALLRGSIACGLGQYDQADQEAEVAIDRLESASTPMDLARAHLLKAWSAASKPVVDRATLTKSLERAVQVADQLGHDAFLVAETLSLSGVLQRAGATQSGRMLDWLRRHQELLLVAQALKVNDKRPVLVVRTLGTDQITLDDQPIDIGWRKAREVLYYLLSHPGGASTETLCEAIWPDLTPQGSSEALRRAIYRLRAALPRGLISSRGQRYQLNRQVVQLDYDVEQFLQVLDTHARDQEALVAALERYEGHYLPWSDSSWSRDMRTTLEQRYLFTLRSTAERCLQTDAHLNALILYQRILTVDHLDETAHAGVMRSHMALGNRAAAIEQYQQLRHVLDSELGLDPGPEIEQLHREILTLS